MVYESVDRSCYLVHHGILGQKWGKQNGPPYPLGTSDHSAAEKKAGWKKSLDPKKQAKQNVKNAKDEVYFAKRALGEARAETKGNQLVIGMTKRRLQKLESKAKTDKVNKRIAEERAILKDYEKELKRSEAQVKRSEAYKKVADMEYSKAVKYLDIVKGKKLAESIYDESTLSTVKKEIAKRIPDWTTRDYQLKLQRKSPEVQAAANAYDDALDRDWEKYRKQHKHFDGDGSEFESLMLKDKNSETSKAREKYIDALSKYGVSDKEAKSRIERDFKASSHPDRRKAETPRGRQLEEAADRAENKYQDAVDNAMYKYGKRDTPEVKKARAAYDEAKFNWIDYRDSDKSSKDVSKMASRASSMKSSGKTYAEIAKALGIPVSSVGYYLNM